MGYLDQFFLVHTSFYHMIIQMLNISDLAYYRWRYLWRRFWCPVGCPWSVWWSLLSNWCSQFWNQSMWSDWSTRNLHKSDSLFALDWEQNEIVNSIIGTKFWYKIFLGNNSLVFVHARALVIIKNLLILKIKQNLCISSTKAPSFVVYKSTNELLPRKVLIFIS